MPRAFKRSLGEKITGHCTDMDDFQMRAAYADPPYLGCGAKHYGDRHDEAAEYDSPDAHRRLIERLCDEFDSWALSLHEPSLRVLLPMCPDDVRVGAWTKPFAAFKANVTRAWAWEPVIFRFARPRTREQDTWRDFVSEPITMRRGFPGAKPDKFCFWLFEGLNLTPADEFHDLFPGSGAVGEAWEKWKNRMAPEQLELVWSNAGKPTAKLGLLPCPFCGKAETLDVVTGQEFMDDEQEFWQHSDSYAVVCDASTGGKGGCGAIGGFADTEQSAITKWNRGLAPK